MHSPLEERQRIRQVYQDRDRRHDTRYDPQKADVRLRLQQRNRLLTEMFRAADLHTLQDLRILDLGCGGGGELAGLTRWGADPALLHGVDLSPGRLAVARTILPESAFLCADGTALPFGAESFDLVTQFTVFSSVLDPRVRTRLAGEMLRVLRPGGYLLWYDFRVNNPVNRDVRGIPGRELRRLFSGCGGRLCRLTLAPPLARLIPAGFSGLHRILAECSLLQTHLLGLLQKPAA